MNATIGYLLWMHDVIVTDTNERRFQRMLQITDNKANKCHL